MLRLEVAIQESFDGEKNEFVTETFVLELEHSLVSLSKWESFHEKPFLSDEEKTSSETFDYIKDMVLTSDVPDEVFDKLTDEHVNVVNDYIAAKMTATWFSEPMGRKPLRQQVITAELIYYWLIAMGIPFECETWHLNRLLTLVRVCNIKNGAHQKMNSTNKRQAAETRRALNEKRKAKYQTRG